MNIPKPHPLAWAFQARVTAGTIKSVSKEKKGSRQLKAVMSVEFLKNYLCVLLGFFFFFVSQRQGTLSRAVFAYVEVTLHTAEHDLEPYCHNSRQHSTIFMGSFRRGRATRMPGSLENHSKKDAQNKHSCPSALAMF